MHEIEEDDYDYDYDCDYDYHYDCDEAYLISFYDELEYITGYDIPTVATPI